MALKVILYIICSDLLNFSFVFCFAQEVLDFGAFLDFQVRDPKLVYVFICMHLCLHACICACMHACMCVYTYLYTYIIFKIKLILHLIFFLSENFIAPYSEYILSMPILHEIYLKRSKKMDFGYKRSHVYYGSLSKFKVLT